VRCCFCSGGENPSRRTVWADAKNLIQPSPVENLLNRPLYSNEHQAAAARLDFLPSLKECRQPGAADESHTRAIHQQISRTPPKPPPKVCL